MKNTLIQISQNGMGSGDEELGLTLVKNYLSLLNQAVELPKVIAFYNGGVKLISKNSLVMNELKDLEDKGVKLLACKTCLKHFNLLNQRGVGIEGTMADIVELQRVADKVIHL